MHTNMLNTNLIACILLCQAFALTTALGSMGDSGSQWNQNSFQQHRPQQTKGPLGGWDDEVSNPKGVPRDDASKLEHSIPGIPGQSYPNYRKIPDTSFDCANQKVPGYYADMEARCQVYHICQAGGRQNSFLCPVGTIYNQETFVCDWWFNVNCADAAMHASKNRYLFRGSHIGIDGSKINTYESQQEQGIKGISQQSPVGIPDFDSQNKGGNIPTKGQDQTQGQWQQGGNRKGNNWPSQNRGQSQGHPQKGGNQRRGNWPSQVQDQFQGQGQQMDNQKGRYLQSQGQDQFVGHRRQGGQQKGENWPPQAQNKFHVQGQQRGNQKSGSWPPRSRDESQGRWQQGRNQKGNGWIQSQGQWQQEGNQKGRKMLKNTADLGDGQNWQNRIPNMKGHQVGNDRGSIRAQNPQFDMGWKQQGDNSGASNKGGMFQPGQSGRNHPNWNQKSRMTQKSRGNKGAQMPPNVPNYFLRGTDMGKGSANRRMGSNRGSNSNKGFNANSWSLRPQNFNFPSQDRKGSSSEIWKRNDNTDMVHQNENLPPFSSEWQDSKTKDQNRNVASLESTDFSNENEDFSFTKRDADDENQYHQNYNSANEHAWESNVNSESEISWQDTDYDYE